MTQNDLVLPHSGLAEEEEEEAPDLGADVRESVAEENWVPEAPPVKVKVSRHRGYPFEEYREKEEEGGGEGGGGGGKGGGESTAAKAEDGYLSEGEVVMSKTVRAEAAQREGSDLSDGKVVKNSAMNRDATPQDDDEDRGGKMSG